MREMEKQMKRFLAVLLLFSLLSLAHLASANPTLTLFVMTNKGTYNLGETVKINGTVTVDGSPVSDAVVGIQVENTTTANPYLLRSRPTSTSYTGNYPLEIVETFLSDQYGSPRSSVKQGDVAYFRVKVRNTEETGKAISLVPYFQTGLTPLPIQIEPAFQGQIASGIAYNQTLGKTTAGSQEMNISGNTKFASLFKLDIPASCQANVTGISWLGWTENSTYAKAIIYSGNASNGTPLQLVGASQEILLSDTHQWWSFTFSSTLVLTNGCYWLGIIAEATTLHFNCDPLFLPEINASAFAYNNNLYTQGPSNPFGTPTYQNRTISIYANYTLVQNYGVDVIFTKAIPDNAPVGTATIYVNALNGPFPSCLPKNGGTAYCPDKPANFTITSKTAGSGLYESGGLLTSQAYETQSLEGYYELTFKPSKANFTLYATCWYHGQFASASLTFAVVLSGDINGDGRVDGKDIAIASKAFGTKPGDLLWDPRADVNSDGRVDGKDIAIISKSFGQIG
jgi:hypothetical protein